jgi:hypothetical protein
MDPQKRNDIQFLLSYVRTARAEGWGSAEEKLLRLLDGSNEQSDALTVDEMVEIVRSWVKLEAGVPEGAFKSEEWEQKHEPNLRALFVEKLNSKNNVH